MEFTTRANVPDFIQAQETDDLRKPGTIAHLQFKLGGRIESPDRVALGAWPNKAFNDNFRIRQAQAQMTGWDVPLLPIKRLSELLRGRAEPDSAVVMYWKERPLKPGDKREVGFAYGLGHVEAEEGGGRLALTVGGQMVANGEFTLSALVHDPRADEKLTLTLDEGLTLVSGETEETVPPVPEGAARRESAVTWKLKAAADGEYTIQVKSNKGATQSQKVRIRTRGVFD
jgi:hypothetical protein